MDNERKLAVVTGASSGIGYELAEKCAEAGFDLLVVADDPNIQQAAQDLEQLGTSVEALEADLATVEGVDRVMDVVGSRPVEYLLANAGHGLGNAFLDQKFDDILHVINTNITGTVYLVHQIAAGMRQRGSGRVLFTGSIAGFMPGTYQAVYNASKAFINSFSFALRAELKDTGVTVTCLMPGETDTDFFERAGMLDTKVAQDEKDDPVEVAKAGFEAMMNGEGDVVAGWKNKLRTTIANVTPSGVLAEQHRKLAEPGSAHKASQRRKAR